MIDSTAWADLEEQTVIPGFHGKFIHSARMTFVLWRLDAGALLPEHAHPHEQVVHVSSGTLEMTLSGETTHCGPGTVLVIPPHTPHSGRVLAAASVMDVFSPVRDDYRAGGEMLLAQALEG